ncbi:hypothetical protein L0F63_002357 [Massospora cicadina]|nr:hypothetical protein L0F63_002357 [Massospora cicadina]
MNIALPVSAEVKGIGFSIYTPDELRRITVKGITEPETFNVYAQPNRNGLYDAALGATVRRVIWSTPLAPAISATLRPFPVINALFFDEVMSLLRSKCFICHKFKLDAQKSPGTRKISSLASRAGHRSQNFGGIQPPSATVDTEGEDKMSTNKGHQAYVEGIEELVESILLKNPHRGYTKSNASHCEFLALSREVVAACRKAKACGSCKGPSVSLRQDSHYKILEIGLPAAVLAKMSAQKLFLPNVISQLNAQASKLGEKKYDVLANEAAVGEVLGEGNDGVDGLSDASEYEESEEESVVGDKLEPVEAQGFGKTKLLTPLHVYAHIKFLFSEEPDLAQLLYGGLTNREAVDARMFFYEMIPVPPNRFRPAAMLNDAMMENTQTVLLSKILAANKGFQGLKPASASEADQTAYIKAVMDGWLLLQRHVNAYVDSNYGLPPPMGKEPIPGIKQVLEKKEGLFRKHMMGKRVNYAARSVISPDVNLETNEIGLPPVFALKLTYPEPVTHYNVKKLQAAVIRGPSEWPGATHVQNEDGTLIQLDFLSTESRIALAHQLFASHGDGAASAVGGSFVGQQLGVNKKVYRHIENGDVVLFNRQPTLHKPSIMAHRVRVLPGEKTIRMHYANCNTYNADFDGDEMNVHFPQNEVARAEAMLIANTDNQYLVPTSGAPLRGLIQDHVAVAVYMTSRDAFFTREQYHQLLYGSLRPEEEPLERQRIIVLPPALQRPHQLWTGKQVISTILANITRGHEPLNLESKARVGAKYWEGAAPEEGKVTFCNGEFVTGVLDKSQFGASSFGLVHTVYELYGAPMAGKLLGILGRLFTKYCQSYGFTCRMDDLLLTEEGDAWRRDLIAKSTAAGQEATVRYIGLQDRAKYADFQVDFTRRMEEVYRDDEKLQGLDATMKSKMNTITSSIIDRCIPHGLFRKFPENHMQVMTVSGAKGSNVNVSQISCLLGQQELEGRRVPLMISGKTLPSFQPFETSARAGGFIAGRFLTGIKPQEYFFHCMAGREGLIDTAVKTSRSGYLQRCLIKHLESLRVHYDSTVRDSDGSILQFHYGEDGLDVTKQKHLTEFSFVAKNYPALKRKHHPGKAVNNMDYTTAPDYNRKAIRKPHRYGPTLSVYSASRYFGAVSEKFYREVEDYMRANPDNLLCDGEGVPEIPGAQQLNRRLFRALMNLKYMQSLAEPGEAVGLLAAQSVGEPSTQMTLNTFHFAGFGAKNVTLGIPRLREIVMTASQTIKTPSMTLAIKPEISDAARDTFCRRATKLRLSEVTNEIEVTESIAKGPGGYVVKEYRVLLKFYPEAEYASEFSITRRLVEAAMPSFVKRLEHLISLELRRQGVKVSVKGPVEDEPAKPIEDILGDAQPLVDDLAEEEDEDSDGGDGDASDARRAAKRSQMASYDAPDDHETDDDGAAADDEDALPVQPGAKYVTSYKFDHKEGGWAEFILNFDVSIKKILMVGLAETACKQSLVRHIERIDRVFPITNEASDDTRRLVATEGMNLMGIWQYCDIIDVDSIETNDIYAVLVTYGVEAARNAIKKEIGSVFAVYGIEVDPRHLSLIADYMTFEGGYKPFNRLSMKTNTSPFQQMSYETTVSFLTKAALTRESDDLTSPSSKIVLGKVVDGGTGSFQLLHPLQPRA